MELQRVLCREDYRVQVTPRLHVRALVIIAVLAQAVVMWWTLKHMISPGGYSGLVYRAPNVGLYLAMVALTMAVAFLLPHRLNRPSDVILWIVFTITVAPSIQVPQYLQVIPIEQASVLGVMVAGCFLIARGIGSLPPLVPRLTPPLVSPASFWLVVAGLTVVVYAFVIVSTGISLSYLSFDNVYNVRAEFIGATTGIPIVGYGLPIVAGVVNPLIMAVGLLQRRFLFFTFGAAGQVVIYATQGTKSTLFSIVFILAIAPLAHRRAAGSFIPFGFSVMAAASALIDLRTHSVGLTGLLTRRVLIVPGALTAAYVSIYSDLPKVHFAELGFGQTPLLSTPHTVGRIFTGDITASANTSLFGHGYAQFGFFGILVECIFFGIMLRCADWATTGLPPMIGAAMFIMPAAAISEASIFTAFATHGFLAAVVLSAVAPRSGWTRRGAESGLEAPDRIGRRHGSKSPPITTATHRQEDDRSESR